MPDILIRGLKMPRQDDVFVQICADGVAVIFKSTGEPRAVKAVELPEHGDLIDRVAFRAEMDNHYPFGRGTQRLHGEADAAKSTIINMLANALVIVPSNEETK